MHLFSRFQYQLLAISTIFFALLSHISIAAAESSNNESVVWNWPEVDVGPKATDVVHTYNALDTVNASWTSNLDFNPFLVVWCETPGGWTASM